MVRLMIGLGVVLALIGGGLVGLFQLAQSEAGRERLAAWLVPVLSNATGYRVEIAGIGPGLPSRIGIEALTLADADGVWLALERLRVVWSPAELLRGRFAVGVVDADNIDLARLPVAGEAETGPETPTKFAIPAPPFDVRIGRLAVGTLALGKSILGEPAQLRVDGRLGVRVGGVISTNVAIVRTDGREGRIEADAQLAPETRRLRIDAKVNEGAGGLIVRLLDLTPYPPLTLTLTGDGPLEDWRGAVEVQATGLASLGGELNAAVTGTATRIGLNGRAEWHGAMPAALRPATEDGIHIGAAAEITTDGRIVVDVLRLDGRDLAIDASGRFDPETSAVAGKANMTVGPAALAADAMAGYGMAGMSAEAVVSGRLDAIEAAAAGAISGLAGPAIKSANLTWQSSFAPLASGEHAVGMSVAATAVALHDPRLAALLGPTPAVQVEGRLSANGDTLDLQTARVTAAAATISAGGRLAFNDAASDLRIEAALADLATLQPLIGRGRTGEVRIGARVQGPLATGAAEAHIDGTAKDLRTGVAVADAALGAAPSFIGDLRFDPAAGLAVHDLRLSGANVRITGEARTDAAFEAFSATGEAKVPDLAPLARAAGTEASGSARLEASALGSLADPDARLRLVLSDATLAGFAIDAGEIDAAASGLASHPAGDVRATLKTKDGPMEASTRFAVEDGALRLSGLSASGFGAGANGDLGMDMASGLWHGRLQVALPASANVPFGGGHLRGQADARITLTPSAGRQSVDIRLQGHSLAFTDSGGEALGIGKIETTVRMDDALAAPQLDATARASAVRIRSGGPYSLALRAVGPGDAINVRLDVDGPTDRLDHLAAAARVGLSTGRVTVAVTMLDGVAGGYPLALSTPLRIVSGGDRLQVDDLDLAVGPGRLAARLELEPGNTAGSFRLERVPVAILHGWLPSAPVAGTLNGNGALTTSGGNVRGEMTLSIGELSFASAQGIASPAIAADARIILDPAGTDLRLTVGEAGANTPAVLTAMLTLPLRLVPGAFDVRLSPEAPLAGDVHVRADLARIAEALGLSDQRLAGKLAGDVRLGGSVSRPEAMGALTITGGVYENFVTGTLISGITGRAGISEGRTAEIALSGTPAGGGSLAVEGRVSLGGDAAPNVDLSIDARDARLIARDDVTATLGGHLMFRGGPGGGRLAGNLTVTPVEIRLRDRLPPSVVVLPVIEINAPGGKEPSLLPTHDTAAFLADLDVIVDMPRRVFVRGRGLEFGVGRRIARHRDDGDAGHRRRSPPGSRRFYLCEQAASASEGRRQLHRRAGPRSAARCGCRIPDIGTDRDHRGHRAGQRSHPRRLLAAAAAGKRGPGAGDVRQGNDATEPPRSGATGGRDRFPQPWRYVDRRRPRLDTAVSRPRRVKRRSGRRQRSWTGGRGRALFRRSRFRRGYSRAYRSDERWPRRGRGSAGNFPGERSPTGRAGNLRQHRP